jgi:molybdopterin-biosynthesis enzyme MoeA-like protein
MRAGIIGIGRGEDAKKQLSRSIELIQKELSALGMEAAQESIVPADKLTVHKIVAEALSAVNVLILTGGMGDAAENLAVTAVSAAIGFRTVMKHGELFPEGASILSSPVGGISGCAISAGTQCIILLPSDPAALPSLLVHKVSRYLAEFAGWQYSLRSVRTLGMSEKEVSDAVLRYFDQQNPIIAVFGDGPETAIQIFATGATRELAAESAFAGLKLISGKLGKAVYGIDVENVGQALEQELSRKGLSAAIAVNGVSLAGLRRLGAAGRYGSPFIAAAPDAASLGSPEKLIRKYGASSPWTAALLAGEVCKKFGAGIGLSIAASENARRRARRSPWPSETTSGPNISICRRRARGRSCPPRSLP